MRKVDKNAKTPIYLQVKEIIREMIENGELKEGEVLMSERDLSDYLQVSRMTVNKAILKLVDEGYLQRERKRTIIAKQRLITRYENIQGLTEMSRKVGRKQSNKLVSCELIKLPNWLKNELKTSEETGYKIVRIRYVNDMPLMLDTAYLSQEMYPDVTNWLSDTTSMHELFKTRYGYTVHQAEQIIRPVYLKENQAQLLEQRNGDLALSIKRHSYTNTGKVMEYTESIFLSQKHDFQIALS